MTPSSTARARHVVLPAADERGEGMSPRLELIDCLHRGDGSDGFVGGPFCIENLSGKDALAGVSDDALQDEEGGDPLREGDFDRPTMFARPVCNGGVGQLWNARVWRHCGLRVRRAACQDG